LPGPGIKCAQKMFGSLCCPGLMHMAGQGCPSFTDSEIKNHEKEDYE